MHTIFKKFSAKNWFYTVFILLLTVIQVYFTMQIVTYIGSLTKAVQDSSNGDTANVWRYGLAMVLAAVVMAVVQIIIQFLASHTASDVVTRIRGDLYKKVNDYSLADFSSFSTESLITRTTNDVQNVHLALLTGLRTFFLAPVTMIWSIILIVNLKNTGLSLVTGIWMFVLVATVVVLILLLMPKYKVVQKLTDALNIASRENLTGVRVIRAFNAEKYQQDKFTKENDKFTKAQIFTGKVISLFTPVVLLVMMGMTLSILWVSAYTIDGMSVANARSAFAATNAFVMLASQIVMAFILLITLVILLPRANVCAKRINEVLNHKQSILDPENPVEFTQKGTIEFKNVGYAYPGADKEAVSGLNFKVNRGEVLAFIGATGSGKTTAVNLMARMADCTEGEVLIDGVNVKDVTQKSLRDIIGYVPQRGFLFKGNIKDNIAFCNPEMSLSEVKAAAKIAEADGFVSAKRNEYQSEVAQGGTNFSGGQKQRLCIARAVAKKPEILIFDDSFSALDYRTDKVVRANIKEQMPESTRVIIAQRVGTIMDADQIIVLDKGKVVGHGKHSELIRSCPVYTEIALSQLSKEELGL